MKLAEALIERAMLQRDNSILLERIRENVKVQEGDTPAEDPSELLAKYEESMKRLLWLIQKINETNSKTPFDAEHSISDAIALRDCLSAKYSVYGSIYNAASTTVDRYNRREIKFVRTLKLKDIQDQRDAVSKAYRELDTKLQSLNWTVDLV